MKPVGESSKSPLFRKQALEYYVQSREKAILPRLAKPPVFLLLWILLGLVGTALIVDWLVRVPVYISGPGIVLEQTILNSKLVDTAVALVFVPDSQAHALQIRVGTPVQLQIGAQRQSFTAAVGGVEPGILSPNEIRHRYVPEKDISTLITGPSVVVSIKLGPAFASSLYAGSLISAQVQIGSASLLSSLFGSAQAVGV